MDEKAVGRVRPDPDVDFASSDPEELIGTIEQILAKRAEVLGVSDRPVLVVDDEMASVFDSPERTVRDWRALIRAGRKVAMYVGPRQGRFVVQVPRVEELPSRLPNRHVLFLRSSLPEEDGRG